MLTREYIRRVQLLMDQTDVYASSNARFVMMDALRARVRQAEQAAAAEKSAEQCGELKP